MSDDTRIEDLRRRVRRDPASIVFAQLAEELFRAGRHREAVSVCRAGLARHPDYASARVTLGRALLALDQLDEAERELRHVQMKMRENLVASRALDELRERRARSPVRPQADTTADQDESRGVGLQEDQGRQVLDPVEYLRMARTVAALEAWLAAIYVTRAERRT